MGAAAQTVVLASRNAGKLAELQPLLAPLGWQLKPLSEFTDRLADENAPSFVENALVKARFAAAASGLAAIADDSGLLVDALGGAPGVVSARYAGPDASDADNNQKLLGALKRVPDARRGARYVCVMVYLSGADDRLPVIAQGSWRGTILHNPSGAGGFGYDPLFFVPELKRSAAELAPEIKHRVSHRGKAARHLLSLLQQSHG
ncbi:MAG: RdgB/HAM1 family non-canonical purine NTP pyrophosphatase [Gammaproteobacteria bacterium]|nr:RdgB/HAM1 family non-canonical purine NTP pyrophosphatase [Gammaproteobacteria bacterium]